MTKAIINYLWEYVKYFVLALSYFFAAIFFYWLIASGSPKGFLAFLDDLFGGIVKALLSSNFYNAVFAAFLKWVKIYFYQFIDFVGRNPWVIIFIILYVVLVIRYYMKPSKLPKWQQNMRKKEKVKINKDQRNIVEDVIAKNNITK